MNLNDRFGMEILVLTESFWPCETCGAVVTTEGMERHNQWHNREEALRKAEANQLFVPTEGGGWDG